MIEPRRLPVDAVFATFVVNQSGLAAAFFWERTKHYGKPLTLIDYDVDHLSAATWRMLVDRMRALRVQRRARYGSLGVHVEGAPLAEQARVRGVRADAVPEHLTTTAYWPRLVQSAAAYQADEMVGITRAARGQMDARPFFALND